MKLKSLWQSWNQFWFEPKDLFAASAFRFVFSLVLFIMYAIRGLEFSTFFSEIGLLPQADLNNYVMEYLKPPFTFFSASEDINRGLYALLLLFILLMVLGLATRLMTIATFFLHLIFLQRNPAILYGADLVATFWLFGLCWIQHHHHFSIKKWLPFLNKAASSSLNQFGDIFSSVGIRLIQIQLCIIYAYTGMEKLKGGTWWEGSAVWYVMGNDNIVPFDLSFFQYMPWAVAIMTYSTLLFEIYFPIAIWLKPLRPTWLFLGLCLHALAFIFMGLIFFSPIMLSAYLLFVPHSLQKTLLPLISRWSWGRKFVMPT